MALSKVEVKNTRIINGVHIEKGMSVEVATNGNSNPLSTAEGREKIVRAFENKYGVDLKHANAVSTSYLNVEKQ